MQYEEKLAARYEEHSKALKEAMKSSKADSFVVVPTYRDEFGSGIVCSAFVETMQGGGYKVNFGDEPYSYILPTAMEVAKKMRKATGKRFTWIKVKEWHEKVLEVLEPYKKA